MADQQDNSEIARLTKVNKDLTRSIGRCRELVEDCRSKLAANSNEAILLDHGDDKKKESDLA